jgi:apolipoprotein N-acyltransferase
MKLTTMTRLGLTFAGGVVMGLTPAPMNIWPLGWVALVPLWMAIAFESRNSAILSFFSHQKSIQKNRLFSILKTLKQEPKLRFWLRLWAFPLVWGLGYHGVALSWILGIHPMTWMGVPWWPSLAIALFCWGFISLWGAGLVVVWATVVAIATTRTHVITRLILATATWCILESVWSAGDLWWTAIAYTQSPNNLAILHLSQLSGPNTVAAAIVAVNGAIAEGLISYVKSRREEGRSVRRVRGLLVTALILFCTVHAIGFYLFSHPLNDLGDRALKVGLIQGNIPNEIKLNYFGYQKALYGYTTGYETLTDRGVDIVLTPETALPYLWTETSRESRDFYRVILEKNIPAWVGTFARTEDGNITNSLLTVTRTGETYSRYDKTKLVPLGEYIPFEEILGKFIDRLSPLDAHLVHGDKHQIFETPFGRAIVGICYDSAFPEHFRRQAAAGGQFILSASNDAHYTPVQMHQHNALDLMRAVESDRWIVRATNTGLSSVIDPHGRILWRSQINRYQEHIATIYRRDTQTLYVRWGDWLTRCLGILAVIVTGLEWRIRKFSS